MNKAMLAFIKGFFLIPIVLILPVFVGWSLFGGWGAASAVAGIVGGLILTIDYMDKHQPAHGKLQRNPCHCKGDCR